VEENLIVNEIEFGETSNGAAMVQGSYVAQGASEWFFHLICSVMLGRGVISVYRRGLAYPAIVSAQRSWAIECLVWLLSYERC
jgi:hypothetical protein